MTAPMIVDMFAPSAYRAVAAAVQVHERVGPFVAPMIKRRRSGRSSSGLGGFAVGAYFGSHHGGVGAVLGALVLAVLAVVLLVPPLRRAGVVNRRPGLQAPLRPKDVVMLVAGGLCALVAAGMLLDLLF